MSKRLFDVVVASVGLMLLSPLMMLVAALIKIDTPGTIFYRGLRVGRGGLPFRILKFRTMAENAAAGGPGITVAGDPRITRIGKILRRTKMDELPQLWNVIRGEMSLVGPRPEDPRYVALYNDQQRQILCLRPGITSPASIQYRHEEALLGEKGLDAYETMIMPKKIAADLDYFKKSSFWGDIKILIYTFAALFHRTYS